MSSHTPFDLEASARQSMIEHGFEPDYPAEVRQQVAALKSTPPEVPDGIEDLRDLLWSSIDNDTSRDLDQIEYADTLPDGSTRVRIGIADVDAYVPKGSAIDKHAAMETVTIYTGVRNYSMLPEELSTGLTSLLEGQDRLCVVTEFVLDHDKCETDSCVASRCSMASANFFCAMSSRASSMSRATAVASCLKYLGLNWARSSMLNSAWRSS